MKVSELKILFVSSEVFPLIKTGGLADVSSGLPLALNKLGHDVRLIMPAYKSAVDKVKELGLSLRKIDTAIAPLLETNLPNSSVPIWLIDIPELYYRLGGPYGADTGGDWPDNDDRFNKLCDVAIDIALNNAALNWTPDIVHCNDWQTGLIPAKLSLLENRPATIFTIHNLAYFGLFPQQTFEKLNLPEDWWEWDKLEFHDQLSFIKGGLVFADYINAVSPSYANEILTKEFAYGLEGLLNHRGSHLTGILNGIDYDEWNPECDPFLKKKYTITNIDAKSENKRQLQKEFSLPINNDAMLIGMIGRMVEQKGFDLVIQALPDMMKQNIQLVILGSGESQLENALLESAAHYPTQFSVRIGYNESMSHMIEGGADCFLMPSRFEPCGLNQFYSLRYGTLPIVHNTGGLADSVVDCNVGSMADNTATGFKFYHFGYKDLLQAFYNALKTYQNPPQWQQLVANAMKQDFSWSISAHNYVNLYHKAIKSQYTKSHQ